MGLRRSLGGVALQAAGMVDFGLCGCAGDFGVLVVVLGCAYFLAGWLIRLLVELFAVVGLCGFVFVIVVLNVGCGLVLVCGLRACFCWVVIACLVGLLLVQVCFLGGDLVIVALVGCF